jgi:hypothetical protein
MTIAASLWPEAQTPPAVLLARHWLKIPFIVDAVTNAATVVKLPIFGDRADVELVGKTVSEHHLPVDPDRAVALAASGSGPQPASTRAVLVDLGPEPFLKGRAGVVGTAMLPPPVIVLSAPIAGEHWLRAAKVRASRLVHVGPPSGSGHGPGSDQRGATHLRILSHDPGCELAAAIRPTSPDPPEVIDQPGT